MSNGSFSADELAQLAGLAAMADDQFDLSDIPEIPDEQWAHAQPGKGFRPRRLPQQVLLDPDLLRWFERHAGSAYQTEINRVLRRHVADTD